MPDFVNAFLAEYGELLAEGRGRSKKAAEQHAAKVALEKLQ